MLEENGKGTMPKLETAAQVRNVARDTLFQVARLQYNLSCATTNKAFCHESSTLAME